MLNIILDIKMRKLLLLIVILLFFISCSQQNNNEKFECCDPHATIYLQPYEDFSEKEVEKLLPTLEKYFNLNYGYWNFEIKKPINLPLESKQGKKYKSIIILNSEKKLLKGNEIIIGLTHKDICTDAHNIKNYGIVGQSYCPGNVCIVSDKRLKDKSQIYKPILHEFMHAFYGSKHCPNDDPTCFMVDAKGKGNFSIQNKLCDKCIKK